VNQKKKKNPGYPQVVGDRGGGDQHWKDAEEFCSRLAKAVEEGFIRNQRLELKDLSVLPLEIPTVFYGCPLFQGRSLPVFGSGDVGNYCPLQPLSTRNCLADLVHQLDALNREMLARAFEEGTGSG